MPPLWRWPRAAVRGVPQNGGLPTPDEEFTIAMVTHEAPGDTFWDKIRNGAEQAAADHGITLELLQQPGRR